MTDHDDDPIIEYDDELVDAHLALDETDGDDLYLDDEPISLAETARHSLRTVFFVLGCFAMVAVLFTAIFFYVSGRADDKDQTAANRRSTCGQVVTAARNDLADADAAVGRASSAADRAAIELAQAQAAVAVAQADGFEALLVYGDTSPELFRARQDLSAARLLVFAAQTKSDDAARDAAEAEEVSRDVAADLRRVDDRHAERLQMIAAGQDPGC